MHAQARADAQAAVALLSKELEAAKQHGGPGEPDLAARLAGAYLRLGEALLAQPEHEDRDCLHAFEVILFMHTFFPPKGRQSVSSPVVLQECSRAHAVQAHAHDALSMGAHKVLS